MFRLAPIIVATVFSFGLFPYQTATSQEQRGNIDRSGSAVLGFDMWCQEVETLSEARCNQRRTEDLKAYEQYRVMMERYQEERNQKLRKEREITNSLQRDPLATVRDKATGVP